MSSIEERTEWVSGYVYPETVKCWNCGHDMSFDSIVQECEDSVGQYVCPHCGLTDIFSQKAFQL